jgi:hypothetical protein
MIHQSVRTCKHLLAPVNTRLYSLRTSVMSFKYCLSCTRKCLLSCFLSDLSNLASKELKTCASCQACTAKSTKKRKALQPLDSNVLAKKRLIQLTKALTRPEPVIALPNPPKLRLKATIPLPNLPESCLRATIPLPNPPESCLEATILPKLPESCLETLILILTPFLI